MITTLYVIDKETGKLLRKDIGVIEFLINDLTSEEDFTLTAPPTFSQEWVWKESHWLKSDLNEERKLALQESIWEAIKQRRYEATVSGVYVPSIDKVFHTDATSVIQYNNIGNMIALGNYEPIQWKVMDNTWITLTEEVFKELQTAMVQNTNRIYQVAEEHKAKMMESDNPEEYDYSTGWEVSVS